MNNNKNRVKDRHKSNAELRKIRPKDNMDKGMINAEHTGTHSSEHEKG